jgi:hypothetical protein
LKEENKEIRTAFDLAQLCWIIESNAEFSKVMAEEAFEELLEGVVLIRLQQRGPPWCHLQVILVEL